MGSYLDDVGSILGDPFNLSGDLQSQENVPDLTGDEQVPTTWFGVWEHAQPLSSRDVHGRLFRTSSEVGLLGPVNWTMVLSLQPTFRWAGIAGAVTYRLTVYPYTTEEQTPQPIVILPLDADLTNDPENLDQQRWKLETELSSGKTLLEAGYSWKVEALDDSGATIASSLLGAFQIPPLGINSANPNWNRYDDLIYSWSEARDLPPTLVKAVIVKEHGFHLNNLPNGQDARFDYLYEPKADYENCVLQDSRNACNQSQIDPYRQRQGDANPPPNGLFPRLLLKVNGKPLDHVPPPSIADFGADPVNGGITVSDYGALAGLTKCSEPDIDNPADFPGFYDCVNEWFEDRFSTQPPAQYRIMASYGLGQATYWSYYHLQEFQTADGILPPEVMYDPDLALSISTAAMGENRCYYYRDTTLGKSPPYSRVPTNPYLGADSIQVIPNIIHSGQDYETELGEWRKDNDKYQGIYPELRGQFHAWWRSLGKYNGYYTNVGGVKKYEREVGSQFLQVQPVDLSSGSLVPDVQVEQSPVQMYQASINFDTGLESGVAFEDTAPLHCPLLPSELEGLSQVSPASSLISISRSLSGQANPEVMAQIQFDLDGDGVDELLTLEWLGSAGEDIEAPGVLRVYQDGRLNQLIIENYSGMPVERAGWLRLHELASAGEKILQTAWMVGAHGERDAFYLLEDGKLTLIPFETAQSTLTTSVVGDGGGAILADDGSVVVLNRGEMSSQQSDISVYELADGRFRLDREYIRDSNVHDDSPPATTLTKSPLPNDAGWNQAAVTVLLASEDNQAVAYLFYEVDGAVPKKAVQTPLDRISVALDEGRWIVRYRAQDIYGNLEQWKQEPVLIDSTPPGVQASLAGKLGEAGWYTSPVEVTLQAEDSSLQDGTEGSGVAHMEYSMDEGKTWQEYLNPFMVVAEGTSKLFFRATDLAGNSSDPVSQQICIDTQPPELNLSIEPGELWPPNGKQVQVRLSGEISDQTSGPAALAVSIGDEYGEWEPSIAPRDFSSEGPFAIDQIIELVASRRGGDKDGRTYSVRVAAEDRAGNEIVVRLTVIVPHDQRDGGR